jgi:hypothetical protein
MQFTWLAVILAALVPLVVGMIYYNPKVMGNLWMKETGLTEDELKKANMAKIFGLTTLFSVMLAFAFPTIVIHQMHLTSIIQGEVYGTPTAKADIENIIKNYGGNFRTLKHGAFHGFLFTIFVILPIFGTNALFERKSFKYIFIHVGYWAIVCTIMGAIISYFKP